MFASTNKDRFVDWLAMKLLPKLRHGDVLVLDNLSAHDDAGVAPLCDARGVRVIYLPPYSHDFNPIELGWALQKQQVRRFAPRDPAALRHFFRGGLDKTKMTGHITIMKPSHRDLLLATGLRILHERGFNATSVQDITEAAGVPKGSFYNHFESKEDLGAEV